MNSTAPFQQHGTVAERLEGCRLIRKYIRERDYPIDKAASFVHEHHDIDLNVAITLRDTWDSR